MEYQKDKMKRLVEYKENVLDIQLKEDLSWILETYNLYFIKSREYENQNKNYKNILNNYYNATEEVDRLKRENEMIKRKYITLKNEYNSIVARNQII